jgi:hypothetical protein
MKTNPRNNIIFLEAALSCSILAARDTGNYYRWLGQ